MQKVRCHSKILKLQLFVSTKFQYLFNFYKFFFTLSFTVLVHYQTSKLLDFEGGPPIFKQYTTCTALLY
jgi:hypothetical protein